jgi:hypothetical protein
LHALLFVSYMIYQRLDRRGELVAAPSWWRTLKSRIKRRRAAVDMIAGRLCGRCWVSEVGARARRMDLRCIELEGCGCTGDAGVNAGGTFRSRSFGLWRPTPPHVRTET